MIRWERWAVCFDDGCYTIEQWEGHIAFSDVFVKFEPVVLLEA